MWINSWCFRLQVYSLFLDALCDFIVVNKVDLHDWLFVLLSRLLTKLGTELLNSLQSKVVRVLDVIRWMSFRITSCANYASNFIKKFPLAKKVSLDLLIDKSNRVSVFAYFQRFFSLRSSVQYFDKIYHRSNPDAQPQGNWRPAVRFLFSLVLF